MQLSLVVIRHRDVVDRGELMSCILRVSGVDLEPDDVLAGSHLQIDRKWRRGEPRRPVGPASAQINVTGGFTAVVSDTDGDHVPKQVDDAIVYLKDNYSLLEAVLRHPDVENRFIDFAWWFPVDEDRPMAQACRFPVELLKLCADLDLEVEVSVYGASGDEQ